jgi:hypothetical protein
VGVQPLFNVTPLELGKAEPSETGVVTLSLDILAVSSFPGRIASGEIKQVSFQVV